MFLMPNRVRSFWFVHVIERYFAWCGFEHLLYCMIKRCAIKEIYTESDNSSFLQKKTPYLHLCNIVSPPYRAKKGHPPGRRTIMLPVKVWRLQIECRHVLSNWRSHSSYSCWGSYFSHIAKQLKNKEPRRALGNQFQTLRLN